MSGESVIQPQKPEYLCKECGKPFDPAAGFGPYRVSGERDGVRYNEELGIRMTCGRHSWELPGKTMVEVIADFPVMAPWYIHTKLADDALSKLTR